MLEIDLYNRNLDFTLFSKSEISEIKKKYGDDIIPNHLGNEFGVTIDHDVNDARNIFMLLEKTIQ